VDEAEASAETAPPVDIAPLVDPEALTETEAEAHVQGVCFKTGPPGRIGVELEWLVRDSRDPAAPIAPRRVAQALAGLGEGNGDGFPGEAVKAVLNKAFITVEPGGQVELSSAPANNLGELIEITLRDLTALRDAAARVGLELCGYGLDPLRPPERMLTLPRYAAMEEYFDRHGPWGRQMMCGTASVQVCVDAGDDSDGQSGYRSRWEFMHTIGPVLVAAFANSPLRKGRPTGWRSARQQVWANIDPRRTRAPHIDDDPRAAWATYALDADVMCVRDPDSTDWSAPPGLTFRDWLRGSRQSSRNGSHRRQPTRADLDYHLSTLFPPVRPRGHLELRMIDAQPGDGWIVPTAVVSALADDPAAADAAMAAAAPIWAPHQDDPDPWLRAARCGPADPELSRASKACFEAAGAALRRAATPAAIIRAVDDFTERYVQRDRCPADDQLEEGT
jgi:glutamate--cysteine ligase